MVSDEPLNAYEGATELQAAHARLLERLESALDGDASEVAESRALQSLQPEIAAFLARGAATGIFLEPVRERTACQVLLDYWSQRLVGAGASVPAARLSPFDGERLPTLEGKPCPYVGLESFRGGAYFFGRDEDTRELVALIRATPLVVVLGASGSGKSSLVMGGVLPALGAESGAWRVFPVWVPGESVLAHFARALVAAVPACDAAALAATLRSDPGRLLPLLGDGAPAVVTIDQFEEVFTLASAEERQQLAAVLAALLNAGRGHRVVLTVREEFRSRIVELRALERWIDAAWYSMRPMGYEQLRAAVEGPAAIANLQFQPDIVDDLVKKVLGQPAALPLLQFTLRALWDARDRNRITWEVYRGVGDPLTALKKAADSFYFGQAPQTQDEIKRLLLELVRVDEMLEAYRQPVRLQQLRAAGRANTEAVLQLLAQQDYVRLGEDGELVEVKHEALIRNWPLLVGWIDEKRLARRQRMALMQAAKHWDDSGRPHEGLLTGWQLQEAQRQEVSLGDVERDYVEASAAAILRANDAQLNAKAAEAVRKIRQKTMFVSLLILVPVALGLAYWSYALNEQVRASRVLKRELEQTKEQLEKNIDIGSRHFIRRQNELEAALEEVNRRRDELLALSISNALKPAYGAASSQPLTLYIHIVDETQRVRAEQIARQFGSTGIVVPGVERVAAAPNRSQLRFFSAQDRTGASEVLRLLREYLRVDDIELVFVPGFEGKVPMRRYEVWFARGALGGATPESGLR